MLNLKHEMKRFAIVGISGSGKSTFTRKLYEKTRLNLYHLDNYFWNEDWEPTPIEEWKEIHNKLMSKDEWILDGDYSACMLDRFKKADTIFFFDFDRMRAIFAILKRRMKYHGKTRPDMAEGCRERLDLDFLRWVWNYPNDEREDLLSDLECIDKNKKVVFKNGNDVEGYLSDL